MKKLDREDLVVRDRMETRGNSKKLKKSICRRVIKKYSFPYRSIIAWNGLDEETPKKIRTSPAWHETQLQDVVNNPRSCKVLVSKGRLLTPAAKKCFWKPLWTSVLKRKFRKKRPNRTKPSRSFWPI